MFIHRMSMFTRLVAATLCVGVTLAGCTQPTPDQEERAIPTRLSAEAPAETLPAYDYTVDEGSASLHVFTARERDTGAAVATMAVDEAGKVIKFQRDDDTLTLAFHQDANGRFVAAGDANGAPYSFSMMPGDLRTMEVTGDSPEVSRVFKRVHEAFPDIDALQQVSAISWWSCGLCAAALVALGLSIPLLWTIIPALASLIASHGLAALAALTGAELAHLLGCGLALAVLILGDCWECVKSMLEEAHPVAVGEGPVDVGAVDVAVPVRVDLPVRIAVPVE